MAERPMEGVSVVEVAQFTFVPAAGAVLADWGADVIKVEHAVTGDAQRGMTNVGAVSAVGAFAPLMEHPNRGKRSIGLALDNPEGIQILYDLVRRADVFSTNFLPGARARLGLDVEDIRRVNPGIVYVRGSALGPRGEERNKGGYDQSTYWCRGGAAAGVTPANVNGVCWMPAPAHGDSVGSITLVAGISAALFARERTGKGSVVDVSLLGAAAWANALAIDLSLMSGEPWLAPAVEGPGGSPTNPLVGYYRTSDRKWLMLSMIQPGRYWAEFCAHLGRPDLIEDERFCTVEKLVANAEKASGVIAEIIAGRPYAEWRKRFREMDGPWEPVQDSADVGQDPQLRANGLIAPVIDVEGKQRELVAAPVQFDEGTVSLRRAPQFAEHTDEVLRELEVSEERLIELKVSGAVT